MAGILQGMFHSDRTMVDMKILGGLSEYKSQGDAASSLGYPYILPFMRSRLEYFLMRRRQ